MRTLRTSRAPLPQWLRRAVLAAAHYVFALAVVFGVLHSGARYFYCEALGLSPSDPCAETAADRHRECPSGTLSEHHADCCEVVTLTAMPAAAQAAAPHVAPAARVALLPALWLAGASDREPLSRGERAFGRWRPPPRASKDLRTELMVCLT